MTDIEIAKSVELEKIEITDFECLTNNKLVNEELAFKVKVNYQ